MPAPLKRGQILLHAGPLQSVGVWAALLLLAARVAPLYAAQASAEGADTLVGSPQDGWAEGQGELRMQATAHVASLVIRSMYCKLQLETDKACELPDKLKISSLRQWAVQDPGWERILSSLSLYELARWFWQQQDFERSLVSADQAIALKLFPYTDPSLLSSWQQALVRPGPVFKRPKLELADSLILKANGMFELGKRQKSLQYLHHALEAIHLSAALMNGSGDLVPEVVRHLETLSSHVGLAAADILQRMKLGKLKELLSQLGIACPGCRDRLDHLEQLTARLAIPIQVNRLQGDQLQLLQPSFIHMAYGRSHQESETEYMQRMFTQLVGVLHSRYLSDLTVPCTLVDPATNTCSSYLPSWVFTDHAWHRAAQGYHVTVGVVSSTAQQAIVDEYARAVGPPPLPPESTQHLGLDGALPQDVASQSVGQQGGCRQQGGGKLGACEADVGEAVGSAGKQAAAGTQAGSGKVKTDSWLDGLRWPSALQRMGPWLGGEPHANLPPPASVDALVDRWLSEGASSLDLQQLIAALGMLAGMSRNLQPTYGSHPNSQPPCVQSHESGGAVRPPQPGAEHHTLYLPPLPPIRKPLPAPPSYRHCCPVFRRKLQSVPTQPPRSVQSATAASSSAPGSPASGSTQSTPQHSADSSSSPPPSAHQHISSASAGMDGLRQAVDRQLKEHLDRLTRGYQHDKDDPLVVFTLTALTLLVVVSVSFAKHRKRVARFLSENKPFMQLQVMLGSAPISTLPHPATASSTARGVSSPGGPGPRASSAQQRRAIAAALRDAILGSDLSKLESTVVAAEEAGLEVGLVSRAKQLLAQRRKKDRDAERQQQGPVRTREPTRPPAAVAVAVAATSAVPAAAAPPATVTVTGRQATRLSFPTTKSQSNKDSNCSSSVASSPVSSGGNCSDSVSSYTPAGDARDSPAASQTTSRRATGSSTASSPRALYGASFAADLEALGRLASGDGDEEDESGWQQQASRVRRNRGATAAQRVTGGGGKTHKGSSGGGGGSNGGGQASARGQSAMSGLAKGLAHPKVASMYAGGAGLGSHSGLGHANSQEYTDASSSHSSVPAFRGAAQSKASHAQRKSGGWLDWISNSVLATSPTSSTTTKTHPTQPHSQSHSQSYASNASASPGGAYTPAPGSKNKSHSNTHHHHHPSDTSVLQQATPIRTSPAAQDHPPPSHHRGQGQGSRHASGAAHGAGGQSAWSTSPTGKAGFISTLSSWIGYGGGSGGAGAAPGGSASYSSVTASQTSQSCGSSPAPPPGKGQSHRGRHGNQHNAHVTASPASSLAQSLPATLLDSPSTSSRPSPFLASKLNPDAPSFRSMKSPPPGTGSDMGSGPASSTGGAPGPRNGDPGAGMGWQLPSHHNTTVPARTAATQGVFVPPLSTSLACSNLTGLHQTPFHPTTAAAAAAIASKRLRSDPFAQPGSSRRHATAVLMSHASVDHATTPSSDLPFSQCHSPAPSSTGLPTAGSITTANSIHHRSLPDHLESQVDGSADAAIAAAADLGHPSLSLPSMPLPLRCKASACSPAAVCGRLLHSWMVAGALQQSSSCQPTPGLHCPPLGWPTTCPPHSHPTPGMPCSPQLRHLRMSCMHWERSCCRKATWPRTL